MQRMTVRDCEFDDGTLVAYDEMSDSAAAELIRNRPRLQKLDAIKIMVGHSLNPDIFWSAETGEMLVELIYQEIICRVDDDGRVDTETVLRYLGY